MSRASTTIYIYKYSLNRRRLTIWIVFVSSRQIVNVNILFRLSKMYSHLSWAEQCCCFDENLFSVFLFALFRNFIASSFGFTTAKTIAAYNNCHHYSLCSVISILLHFCFFSLSLSRTNLPWHYCILRSIIALCTELSVARNIAEIVRVCVCVSLVCSLFMVQTVNNQRFDYMLQIGNIYNRSCLITIYTSQSENWASVQTQSGQWQLQILCSLDHTF